MAPLHFFVKFLSSTFQFRIVNPEKYTLHTLWCDVYLLQCSTIPEPAEKFKILDMLTERKFDKVIVEMDLLPLAMEPSLQPDDEGTDNHEDEDYNVVSSGWISEEADYSDSNEEEAEDHSNEEEAEDELSFDSDIGGEDEVLEETESDEDQMLDAASIDFDNDFMADGAADEESDSEHRPSRQMRGVPSTVGPNEQIKLEVSLFLNFVKLPLNLLLLTEDSISVYNNTKKKKRLIVQQKKN
ncbi:hypothetical protein ACOSQ2_017423 [Xanthoceras sorbifolium]